MAAPTYPLSVPTSPYYSKSSWALQRKTALSVSPFSGAQQVFEYDFALWSVTLTLPPMKRSDAANWQAFILKLHGRKGTFLLGDPDARKPRGTISGAVTVGANYSVGAFTISISTSQNSLANAFRAGDYIQLGSSGTSKLHMIVDDVNTDSSGNADINIEPPIKTAGSLGDTVVYENAKCLFRMQNPQIDWDADDVGKYGIQFSAVEAL